jgi:MFS family permease
LLLARIGVGVGESALQPPATSLIADYFPRERLGSAMGVYNIGIFFGSGLGYFIGGWIVGLVSAQERWTLPVVGAVFPWQTVFLIIGLPGLLLALLVLTVREPARSDRTRGTVPMSAVFGYMKQHARTFLCLSFGFAASATVNYGIAQWLATFLVRVHQWPASRAGIVQGTLTMTIGVIGVVVGGRLADAMHKRGRVDAPLRVGIFGALGMLVFATAYPFAPNAGWAVALLVFVNFFAAFPWGAASAGVAEIVPAAMRAQGIALFILVLNLVSYTIGPIAVAAITDRVFHDPNAVSKSLAIVNVVGMLTAITLFAIGLPAYRRTFARVQSAETH